jgi:hypothetical protein
MTVAANDRLSGPYSGNGATVAFGYDFLIDANTELKVIKRSTDGDDVTQTLTSQYTVSGVGVDGGGNVTFVTAPAVGETVIIEGVKPKTQTAEYTTTERFPYSSHQGAMDKLARIDQEQQRDIDRTLKFPHGETVYRLPVKPASGTVIFGQNSTGEIIHADLADFGSGTAVQEDWLDIAGVAPGAGWADRLAIAATDSFGAVSVKQAAYGAIGDGTTNARAAIVLADATGKGILFPAGSYLVSTDLTISSPTFFAYGAKLKIPTGVTVTLAFRPDAPLQQIFECAGTGNVAFASTAKDEAYPEWWGVTINSSASAAANLTAMLKGVTSRAAILQCQAGSYWFSAKLQIQTSNITIRGVSRHWRAEGDATRFVVSSATDDTMMVGTDAEPALLTDFVRDVVVEDIELMRSLVPTPPASGSEALSASGLRFQYTYFCYARGCRASEHTVGFLIRGTIRTYVIECDAVRSLAGSSPTNDLFWGLWLDGSLDIGVAGGNASTYINDLTVGIDPGVTLTESVGINITSGCVDIFIEDPETTTTSIGIRISGNGTTTQNVDCHIDRPIIDVFTVNGIVIEDITDGGTITIVSPYCGAAAAATGASYLIDTCNAVVTFVGPQALNVLNSTTPGLSAIDSSNIRWNDGSILDADKPVELTNVTDSLFRGAIQTVTNTASQAAILMTGCSRNVIAPTITGNSNAHPAGISLASTGNADNDIDVAGVDPATINGGAANVLLINSVSITNDGRQ